MPSLLDGLRLGSALLWGLVATGMLTLLLSGSQQMGWTRMSWPYLLGSIFTPNRGRAMVLGLATHFVLGLGFALLYALVFEHLGRSSPALGALLGLYHGLFVLVVGLHVLPGLHPRMAHKHEGPTPTRQLEPPGFLGLDYGWRTPIVTLVGHVAYGALLGLYEISPA